MLWFLLGLALGALIGFVSAFIAIANIVPPPFR